ncbi:hypothetical protein Sjap_026353 [Stephania japonica]|uniref:P-type ATPase C-terminal domain-containing protein n=1 Tax=Stephania japonica TaxID=461633 RepID=A0AAP0E6V2_9MAGN
MDVDVLLDKDLDVRLDSLREKPFLADKEATELRSELQLLEKQSVLSYECAEYVNEAFNSFLMHALAFNSFLMHVSLLHAVMASDFSILQFRFLERLLVVHGY